MIRRLSAIALLLAITGCMDNEDIYPEPCPTPTEPPITQLKFNVRNESGSNLFGNGSYKIADVKVTQPCNQELKPVLDDNNVLRFLNLRQPTAAENRPCSDIYINWGGTETDTISWTFATGGGGKCPLYYTLTSVSFNRGDITAKRDGDAFVITK